MQSDGASTSLGIGTQFHLPEISWRIRIRQAWLSGLLDRNMQLGHGEGKVSNLGFNSYTVTEAGKEFIQSPKKLELPVINSQQSPAISATTAAHENVTQTRQTKGTHLLPVLTNLLSSSVNWYNIESPEDYQYPGIFQMEHPQRLGYVCDVSALPFYTQKDEHFLFNNIQISKGKLRAPRKVYC